MKRWANIYFNKQCLYNKVPYFPVDNARVIYQTFKIRKNKHARYTVQYFPVDNARVIYTSKVQIS
jgi:hypothetical protein